MISPGMDKNQFTIEWGKCNGYDGKPENQVDCGRGTWVMHACMHVSHIMYIDESRHLIDHAFIEMT